MVTEMRTTRNLRAEDFKTREDVVHDFGKIVSEAVGEIVENGWYPSPIHPNNSPKAARLNEAEVVLRGKPLGEGEVPIADAIKVIIKDPALGEGGPDLGDSTPMEYVSEREGTYFPRGKVHAPAAVRSEGLGEIVGELVEAYTEQKSGEAGASAQIARIEKRLDERAESYE